MRRSLGTCIAASSVALVGVSTYNSVQGAITEGGTCASGVTRFVIERHCQSATVFWGLAIPGSVGLMLIGLWLTGFRTMRGAILYQAFFVALGLGMLLGGLTSHDTATRLFSVGMFLITVPIGSTFLIQELVRRRRDSADARSV